MREATKEFLSQPLTEKAIDIYVNKIEKAEARHLLKKIEYLGYQEFPDKDLILSILFELKRLNGWTTKINED